MQAFSVSIDGSAALLNCSENASEALVHSLQQSVPGPDSSAAVAALQCLANLTRTRRGVSAALQAQLPSCLVTVVNQVSGQHLFVFLVESVLVIHCTESHPQNFTSA